MGSPILVAAFVLPTGDTCWFEQAKLCDGIRHAVIEEITE
jgi:hypothetical protein